MIFGNKKKEVKIGWVKKSIIYTGLGAMGKYFEPFIPDFLKEAFRLVITLLRGVTTIYADDNSQNREQLKMLWEQHALTAFKSLFSIAHGLVLNRIFEKLDEEMKEFLWYLEEKSVEIMLILTDTDKDNKTQLLGLIGTEKAVLLKNLEELLVEEFAKDGYSPIENVVIEMVRGVRNLMFTDEPVTG